jgi:hypothetical protein
MLVFTLAVFVAAAGAFADDAPKKKEGRKRPSPDQIFKKLDGDQDGKLTVAELAKSKRIKDEAKAKEVLARWDANKDGSVCLGEFTKAMEKRRAERDKKGGPKKGGGKRGEKKCDEKKEKCDEKKQ